MAKVARIAMIGLDTSHSIAFTQRFQGTGAKRIRGLKVTRCLRFPSPFQSEEQQDERQKTLESWGVEVTRNFKHAVEDVDGIMLEINDPAQHWKYFKKAAECGVPIFIDKPLANSVLEAKKMMALAKAKKIKIWETSALRFSPDLLKAIKDAGEAELVNIYGAMGTAAAGSSLLWYGCHTFQMLNQIMGNKAKRVHAIEGERGVVTTIEYDNGRRGVIESISGSWNYGGRIHGKKGIVDFQHTGDIYDRLMPAIRDFFVKGTIAVPIQDAYACQVFLDAAEKSIKRGKAVAIKERL